MINYLLKSRIYSRENNCFVRIASFWEIAIKVSLNRLELNNSLEQIFKIIEESGFFILPIGTNDVLKLTTLDFHHRDRSF
ncbi:MAG: hypothetical protein IE931_09535 [Sphingobacteriales bacterium]|nr:hypothetical protein [Sphingobacteriales bacterium]